jgi:5-methylcytosine-specific restriction enzyme A
MLLRPCAEPGCPALVSRGRCLSHARPTRWGQGNRGNRRSSAMRALVLREEPVCRYCQALPSTQVDHVIPLSEGGSSGRDNLAGVCWPCHVSKTITESKRARLAGARG